MQRSPPPSFAEVPLSGTKENSARYGGRSPLNMYYVYILLCSDKKPYTGCTGDLKDRINRHQKGYVDNRLPVKLLAYFAFDNKYTAFNFETYLKSGSGRAFLEKHVLDVYY